MEQNNNTVAPAAANKKNLIISGAVILVVLVALFVVPTLGEKKAAKAPTDETTLPEGCKPGFEFSETTGEPCLKDESVTVAPAALSRADATMKYAGSIVRFTGECVADPATLSTTPGKTVMIDNDTDARRTIMVGTKSYSVGAHRYTLSSMNMGQGEYNVSCDGTVVSKITIQ